MIYVLATIELKDAKLRADFLKVFKANVPNVKAEEGCHMYQPTIDFASGLSKQLRVSDSVVTIIEGWESMAHLKKHLESAHMAAYREKSKQYVKGSTLNVVEPA